MASQKAMAVWGLLAAGALVIGPAALPGAAPGGKKKLMRQKLEFSQNLLVGLAEEDFEAIAANAKTLQALTKAEEWFQSDSAEYKAQLNIFKFANDELVRLSAEKELDGASLAYLQLTLSCVNCHKHLRDARQ